MSSAEIDACLDDLDETKSSTLEALRASILRVRPDAEECLSYGVPGEGVVVAGFAAAKEPSQLLPPQRVGADQIDGLDAHDCAKGTLRFRIDEPLPDELVTDLLSVRISMIQ